MTVVTGLLLMPMLAFGQDAVGGTNGHRLADVIWALVPFVVIGILFLFFVIKKQKPSRIEKRLADYWLRHEQHMERMEQLHERIAKALEKNTP